MSEKKKFKFNIIDAIVVIVLIAAICFGGYKLFLAPSTEEATQELSYTLEFYCEEVPSFAAELISVGDPVSDEYKDVPLGTVTAVELTPSVSYIGDAQGTIQKSSKEGYNAVKITADLTYSGAPYKHGFRIDEYKYGVGHSMTIRVGKAKIYGRVAGITEK